MDACFGQSGHGGGDFSFIVSGCSRSELNGEYLQQDQFYGHRPVFYCGDNKQMLFYKEETGAGAWQIHSKPGKRSSARLETKRAPHMAEAQWTVWQKDAEGVGTFVQESDMTCTQGPPPSPEEKRAQAPESLYFDSPTLQCVMNKQEKLMGGRNMYASDEGTGCICIYTDGQEGFYGWLFFQSKEVQLVGQKAITTSHPTRSYSPHLCLWKDGVSVLTAEPKKTRLAPREIGTEPWVDPDFPPTKENVGLEIWEKKSSPTWTRLSEIRDNPVLFNEEDPFDIDQGGLGNCWLIGTMAALAEYQPYLRDHIFVSKDVPPDGRYQIRLFDIKERDWVIHEVDDLVPCHKESSPHHHDIPYFCRGRALWSMILEKAFAKLEGSYQGLSGKANGDLGANQVVFMLTGGTVNHHFRRSMAEQNLWVTQISREVTAGPESTSEKKGTLLAGGSDL
ncbi:unnamed protein product [Durusdinium trenchii]|uniref:Calpain catalytic domain-containing protein n=1 Tax=Durusdinium trenchii TaxID=1381693 RepID=A0ABP0L4C2_9DINO